MSIPSANTPRKASKLVTEASELRRLYWQAFALRLGIAFLGWGLTLFGQIPLVEDPTFYSEAAANVADDWLSGRRSEWLSWAMETGRAWFMVGALAVIYCLTGGIEAIPVALCLYCLLTAWAPVLAYRAGRRLGVPPRGALSAARLVAFSPAFAFWSGALFKEGLIIVIILLIIDHGLRLQQRFEVRSVFVLGLCLLAMSGLRIYLAVVFLMALVVGLIFGRQQRKHEPPPLLRQAIVLVLLLSVVSALGVQQQLANRLSVNLDENLEKIDRSRKALSGFESGYWKDTDLSTVNGVLAFLPIAVVYFMVTPLPWEFGSYRQTMAIPETLFWVVYVYPRVFRGVMRARVANPQGTLFLLVCAVAITCLLALSMGNIGIVFRMRIQVWAILVLFAGWGWHAQDTRVRP